MTTEALLTDFRGGGGGSLASNCAAPLSPGRKRSSAQFAATKEPPSTISRHDQPTEGARAAEQADGRSEIVDERVHGRGGLLGKADSLSSEL